MQEEPKSPDMSNNIDMGGADDQLFYCENGDHPKLGFPTLSMKMLHVAKKHVCPAPKCGFSNESNQVIVDHYETCHVQGPLEICDLCCAPLASNEEEQHYLLNHFRCNACQMWFACKQDLQIHESECDTVAHSEEKTNVSPPSFIASTSNNTSLHVDVGNTVQNFSNTLVKMFQGLNLPEQEIEEGCNFINRFASEKIIVRSRQRREDDPLRQNDLFFGVPEFCNDKTQENTKNVMSLIQQMNIAIFDATATESCSSAMENFLALDKINSKINRLCILCKLHENHAVCLLSSYLSSNVADEVQAYTMKIDLCDLSYRALFQALQYLYCPILLQKVESNILAAKKGRNEDIYAFAANVFNHLDLCSRKLQPEERDSYIESHLKRCIFQNLDDKIQKEIQAKETIWSEFSSQELLDYCLANRQKSEQFSDQYYLVREEQSGDSNCDSSEWENESSDSDNGQPDLNREAAKCRFHPDYAGDDPIKQRLQVLSFKDHKFSTGKWCLFCLEKGHQFFKCKSYSGELHDKLHLIDNQPCGFHTHEECIHHSWKSKVHNVD